MKECIRCGKVKEINEFYKHKKMADGHINACKDCVKKRVRKRYKRKVLDPEWLESERARGREKYHRLNYKVTQKPSKETKKGIIDRYLNRYPEKLKAHSATYSAYRSGSLLRPEGMEAHHWSYNDDHFIDVIWVSNADHNTIHRHMEYDQEYKMYRCAHSGDLLDTRDKHVDFIESIIHSEQINSIAS